MGRTTRGYPVPRVFVFAFENMGRVSFFIDGFNLYHSLIGERLRNLLWLDLNSLCSRFIRKGEALADIYYFTALPNWNTAKRQRHITYLKALRTKNVRVIEGHFKPTSKTIWVNQNIDIIHKSHEEKQSDVALGVEIIRKGFEDAYDIAIIISADGDQTPTIKAAKEIVLPNRPRKIIEVIFPLNRHSDSLGRFADRTRQILKTDLQNSQFPNPITLPGGKSIIMPPEWV